MFKKPGFLCLSANLKLTIGNDRSFRVQENHSSHVFPIITLRKEPIMNDVLKNLILKAIQEHPVIADAVNAVCGVLRKDQNLLDACLADLVEQAVTTMVHTYRGAIRAQVKYPSLQVANHPAAKSQKPGKPRRGREVIALFNESLRKGFLYRWSFRNKTLAEATRAELIEEIALCGSMESGWGRKKEFYMSIVEKMPRKANAVVMDSIKSKAAEDLWQKQKRKVG
jgi:hypothetical protein